MSSGERSEHTPECWAMPICMVCGLRKKPRGRSAPLEMANGLCDHECPGYGQAPLAGHFWPGEASGEEDEAVRPSPDDSVAPWVILKLDAATVAPEPAPEIGRPLDPWALYLPTPASSWAGLTLWILSGLTVYLALTGHPLLALLV